MKIREENLYHGAALNQVAEHKRFTAINALKVKGKTSRSAFNRSGYFFGDSTIKLLERSSKVRAGS